MEMMSGGGGGLMADASVALTDPSAPAQPVPWTLQEAALTFEIRPVGGRDAVTVLAPKTTYEVHYQAGYHAVDSYMLVAGNTSPDAGFLAARPASAGEWVDTGNFLWFHVSNDPGEPVPAPGDLKGYYLVDLVLDETIAGPDGQLCTFTTGSAGELALHLMMWWTDEPRMLRVQMESRAAFLVTEE